MAGVVLLELEAASWAMLRSTVSIWWMDTLARVRCTMLGSLTGGASGRLSAQPATGLP